MLKPFASLLCTFLFMLTLIVTLHGIVHFVASIDSAANGLSMTYYRQANRFQWPGSQFDREQRPDQATTTFNRD